VAAGFRRWRRSAGDAPRTVRSASSSRGSTGPGLRALDPEQRRGRWRRTLRVDRPSVRAGAQTRRPGALVRDALEEPSSARRQPTGRLQRAQRIGVRSSAVNSRSPCCADGDRRARSAPGSSLVASLVQSILMPDARTPGKATTGFLPFPPPVPGRDASSRHYDAGTPRVRQERLPSACSARARLDAILDPPALQSPEPAATPWILILVLFEDRIGRTPARTRREH